MIARPFVSFVTACLVTMCSASGVCQPSHKKFSKQIEARTLTELFESLSTHDNGYFDVVEAGAMQPGFVGKSVVPLRAVLIDNRVARIYEELLGMRRAEAGSLVQSHLKQKFTQYKKEWMEVEGVLFENKRYGITAMLFLTLNFCDESVFDEACCDWLYWYYVNQGKGRDFAEHAGPDTLTLINLYAICLAKRGKSVDALNTHVAELCSQFNCGKLPDFSMQKLVRFEPGSSSARAAGDVLAEFPVLYNWGHAGALANSAAPDRILQARSVSKSRAWVRPSNTVTRWASAAKDMTLNSLEKRLRDNGY